MRVVVKRWYSSGLWLVIEVEGDGAMDLMRSVVVFRAKDFDDAGRRALTLGLEMEANYLNEFGQEVRWRLKQVETVDQLGGGSPVAARSTRSRSRCRRTSRSLSARRSSPWRNAQGRQGSE